MEVLDTSIANVALPYMAGNLGASNDQSTWVLTSYLVSNAIILPISGWLAGALGTEALFHGLPGCLYRELLALRRSRRVSGFCFSSACCKARAAAGCSPWLRPFWRTRFRRNSEAWRLRCTASRPSWRPRSGQPWAGGSPSTIPGGGFFSSISRSAWSHGFWCGALSKILPI